MITAPPLRPAMSGNGLFTLVYVQKVKGWSGGTQIGTDTLPSKKSKMPLGITIATMVSLIGVFMRSGMSANMYCSELPKQYQ